MSSVSMANRLRQRVKGRFAKFRGLSLVAMLGVGLSMAMAMAIPVAMPAYATDTPPAVMMKKPMMAGGDIHDIHACNTNGLALAGVDVVSYHKPTGPLIGSSSFSAQHNGLNYHFLSQAHMEEFVASPERFLPNYLGWCATSLALGALTCPNPLNYKLENGKLLLFETTGFTNGQDLWNADPIDYRRRANRNRDDFLSSTAPTSGP